MDISEAQAEIVLMNNELDKLKEFFIAYGGDIKFAESAVLFANEDNSEFKIEWKRTPFSRQKDVLIYRSDDFYSIRTFFIYDECDFVICCTPESVFKFLEQAVELMESAITQKRYKLYRAILEVNNENNNRHQGER